MLLDGIVAENGPTCTPTERSRARRYRVELLASAAAYTVLLLVSVANVDRIAPGPLKTTVALLPMIGVVGMALAMIRFTRRADEFERQKIYTAAAIAAVSTAVVAMFLGFLENAGLPRVDIFLAWPLLVGIFGMTLVVLRRRYA